MYVLLGIMTTPQNKLVADRILACCKTWDETAEKAYEYAKTFGTEICMDRDSNVVWFEAKEINRHIKLEIIEAQELDELIGK